MAGGRIKGITIEIGGDTTKLESALKSVNSEIRNTESKLKDVNKLLKMDPGNTELLSQKYKTLQTEIKATKEKLDTLKEASKQADQALKEGTISQDQYDALQEESRSISENVRWGQRKKFSDGRYSLNYKHFLGYDKGEDGRLVINLEQAKIVRRIFADFLAGHTPFQIAKALTAEGIPTPAGKKQWSYTTVRRVLSNETYMGDKLLQKTYSIDFLSKDRLKNHGEVPQFYVEQDHDAIIPPETFRRVQDELERRKGCHATGGSIFSGKIYCGECGQIYGSKVWHSNDPYRKVVWQCNGKYGGEKKCGTPTITESDVMRAFEKMLRQMDKQAQIANLREIYADVMDFEGLEQEKVRLEGERDIVGEKYRQEIGKNARVAQNQDEYKKREAELAGEYDRVDAEVKAVEREVQKRQSCGRRIEGLIAALEEAREDFTESLWGSMVEKVTVFEDGLVFTLASGEEVRVAPC